VSLNAGGNRQSSCPLLDGPSFYVSDERRTDARSACIFENDQRREPGNWIVVVDGRNDVGRDQSDDFAISVRRDEGGRFRKLGNRLQALRNFGDRSWIAKLREQLAEDRSVGENRGPNRDNVSRGTTPAIVAASCAAA